MQDRAILHQKKGKFAPVAAGIPDSNAPIDPALKRAVSARLLDVSPLYSEDPPVAFRITNAGSYTYRELPHYFSYLDAMTVDTPIVDRDLRGSITDSQLLDDRLKRGELFRRYLDAQHSALGGKPFAFDWPRASEMLSGEITWISKRRP